MTQASSDEIKIKSQKVDEIFENCMSNLKAIKKKEGEIVNDFNKKSDHRRIEKVKREIEGL